MILFVYWALFSLNWFDYCSFLFLNTGVAKLRHAGRIRLTDQLNPTRQIPCTFFSSTTFRTVDSSATVLVATCLLLTCLPQQRNKSGNKVVRLYCYYCITMHFNNLFLHGLHKSHCIRPSSGQGAANSPLGSKSLATLALTRASIMTA